MTDDKYGDPNTEGRILTAEYDKFYLVTVYTVNAKDDLSRVPLRHDHWDPAFLEYCQGLESGRFGTAKPVIFCGDLNVAHTPDDLARPKPNVGHRGFTDEETRRFSELYRRRFHRYVSHVHSRQRPLFVVEQLWQRSRQQYRLAESIISWSRPA